MRHLTLNFEKFPGEGDTPFHTQPLRRPSVYLHPTSDQKRSLYYLIPLLRRETEYLPMQAQVVQKGTDRNRRHTYVNLGEQLDEPWDQYDQRELTTEDYLGISKRLTHSDNVSHDTLSIKGIL
ncbi:hypothetical protein DPMN_041047 [Dreissena polymorpha]|uniref:Uncharacterized protein n=1 Tax=Dreissena polymorpha TaxID=45954 RepID=A0A9D4CW72_DREPO|nr:hypothetical protein DPMN_041047 [Dreissena polymorpha]